MNQASYLAELSVDVDLILQADGTCWSDEPGTHFILSHLYLWQMAWERYPENKLYKIQLKVDDPILSHG